MYFLYGPEKYFIEQELEKIKKNNSTKSVQIFRFDGDKTTQDLVNLLYSNDLFNPERLFIVYDLLFFEKPAEKDDIELMHQVIELLEKDTKNEFVFINENIKSKSKIVKNMFTTHIFDKSTMPVVAIEAKTVQENDLTKTVKTLARKYDAEIEDDAANALLNKTTNNIMLLDKEVFKLSNQSKNITIDMVEVAVEESSGEDFFGFVNSFESNDLGFIWKKYKESIIEGNSITILISQLSQVLILAHQIYAYKSIGKSLDDLAKELNINSYRIKKISLLLYKLGINKIKRMIKSLSSLDSNLKAGKLDEREGFERFLIKYFD